MGCFTPKTPFSMTWNCKGHLDNNEPCQNFSFAQYQLDTYILFVEKALSLLKPNGFLGYIIPNTWLLNLSSNEIRNYIFNKTQIESIIHYGRSVFPRVTVDTEVIVVKNGEPTEDHQIAIIVISKDGHEESYHLSQQRWQASNGEPVNVFEKPEYVPLADKLRNCIILDEVAKITQGAKPFQTGKGKPKQTKEIVKAKPFVAEEPKDETFRPLLRGSLIQRYRILWDHNYYISFGDWLAEPRYSANFDAPSKIVIRQTGDSLVATIDQDQFIVRDNLYTILPQGNINIRYLLGLINSRLLKWFYQKILNPELGEALAQVKRGHLAKLPIALASTEQQNPLISLVGQMLELYKRFAAANTAHEKTVLRRQIDATDRQIDQLVYQLYDLTPDEIAIVEGQA
jgi:adenine-specific DNA-methyltransferase